MNAVAILEVMWDWRAITSSAGYTQQAPSSFLINPDNLTGSRLYKWLGKEWNGVVTNACPQLVTSAKGRGKPDVVWLHGNLSDLQPFDLLLVCGRVAQRTYEQKSTLYQRGGERVIYVPHPAARGWTKRGLEVTGELIKSTIVDLRIDLGKPHIKVWEL